MAHLKALRFAMVLALVLAVLTVAPRGTSTSPGPGPGPGGAAGLQRSSALTPGPYRFPFALGAPGSPQPWNPATWDVAVHTRNDYWRGGTDPMQAQHGPDCSAPPATHPLSTAQGAVFVCKDHLMTAINAGGYGVIYLTPDHMVDFSGGTALVTFGVSTFRTSDRDWIDWWITPFSDNLEAPLDAYQPDLQGPPRRAVHVQMTEFKGGTTFAAEVFDDFKPRSLASTWWTTLEERMPVSARDRATFQLEVSRTHLRFGVPALGLWLVDADMPALAWTRGVFQMGHHSYNPTKADGCGPPPEARTAGTGCAPNTWHWSGVAISSAVPFTMIRAAQREISRSAGTTATFPAPAPAGSFLRFNGVGSPLQVSFDGGRTWAGASPQAESRHALGFENYWTPVPAGTTRVALRGGDWYGGPWYARDLSIWSQAAPPAPAAG